MNPCRFDGRRVGDSASVTCCFRADRAQGKNVVRVHGLFADGSSWSEVILRLQAAGLAPRN